jgi:hypothetical protein
MRPAKPAVLFSSVTSILENQPFAEITYSALIIERTVDGYAVYGYNNASPYFQIFASASNGRLTTISAGGVAVRVPAQYTNTVVQVPYGYVFTNTTVVVDFILSYGAYLESQGLVFDDRENGYTLNWNQMAQEFLYFSQQIFTTHFQRIVTNKVQFTKCRSVSYQYVNVVWY